MMRFDYAGTGDSSNEFEKIGVGTWIQNIMDACTYMHQRTDVSKVGLIGCRLSSVWAALAAEKLGHKIHRLVMWDPIFDIHTYLYNQLRANLSEQMIKHGRVVENREKIVARIESGEIVSIGGYGFTREFYLPAVQVNIINNPPELVTDLQVMTSSSQQNTEHTDVLRFLKHYSANSNLNDIITLPKEVNWELSKGYVTFPDQTFATILENL